MKKCFLAFASLAALNCFAQSSATLFGVVDVGVTRGRGDVANLTSVTSGNMSSSRIGLRAVEDLGGGLSAAFWLEAQILADSGMGVASNANNQPITGAGAPAGRQGLTFNRRSTVSLLGRWGELRLGREETQPYRVNVQMDPFELNGVAGSQVSRSSLAGFLFSRVSNSISYLLPPGLGGFSGQAQVYLGENASNATRDGVDIADDGRGVGLRAAYAAGPLDAALAYSDTEFASGDLRQASIGLAYKFERARLSALYQHDRLDNDRLGVATAGGRTRGRGALVGLVVPAGPQDFKFSYSVYRAEPDGAALEPRQRKWALGYFYNFSKRTTAYAIFARLTNSGTTAATAQGLGGAVTPANGSSDGLDVGIRHSF